MARKRGISDGVFRDAWKTQHVTGPAAEPMDFRYTLVRQWGPGPLVLWVLANPSDADAQQDDPTCVRGMGFSRRWGFGGMMFVNMAAFCATHPRELKVALAMGYDVVGPHNDDVIRYLAFHLRFVVCAWGDCLGAWGENVARPRVLTLLRSVPGVELKCLGRTERFNPCHPLMLPYARQLESYQ